MPELVAMAILGLAPPPRPSTDDKDRRNTLDDARRRRPVHCPRLHQRVPAIAGRFSPGECAENVALANELRDLFTGSTAAVVATDVGKIQAPLLPHLPTELLLQVVRHLDVRDLGRLACTCRQLYLDPPCPPRPTSIVEEELRRRAAEAGRWLPSSPPAGVSGWVPALLQREWRDSLEMGTVAAGDSPHSLSFDANGALMVCGFEDEHGTLGLPRNQEESEDEDDELRTVLVPTPVRFMSGMRIRKVVAGLKCSLAVGEAGRVYMWGAGSRGRLATDRQDRLVPTLIQELRHHRVRHVATAWDICAAVTEEGLLFTWATAWRRGLLADVEDEAADEAALGRPRLGLGVDGSTINNPWPPQCVMALKKKRVGSVAVGRQFTLVTTEAGVVYSFGDGTRGSLGLGDYETHILPKRVQALDGVHMAAVAAAWFQSLALTASGRVFWWGGRRLTTTTEFEWQSIPQLVDSDFGAGRVRGIAANSLSAYAVTDAGVLFSWESDSCAHACSLPLNGNCQVQLSPWPVAGLHGITVVGVSAGELHALVLAADGSVYAFGRGKALGIGWGVGGSGYPAGLQGDPADEAEGQMILAEAGERMKLTPKKVPGLVCKERRTFPARPGRRVLL